MSSRGTARTRSRSAAERHPCDRVGATVELSFGVAFAVVAALAPAAVFVLMDGFRSRGVRAVRPRAWPRKGPMRGHLGVHAARARAPCPVRSGCGPDLKGRLAIGSGTLRPHRAGFSSTRLGAAVMLR